MKARVINEFGNPFVFETVELKKPTMKPGHVLVKVSASSVNPLDYKLRSGKIRDITPEFPAVLHSDVAGTIEEIADDVSNFKLGDEVYGCAGGVKGEGGALAEYMLVDARLIAKKPKNLTMGEAAALPLAVITAWEALFEKVNIKNDDKVLIYGGMGGVGHLVLQLAVATGYNVYVTASSDEKAEIAKSLGAKEVINYREETVSDYVNRLTAGKGFEVVIDTVGGDNIKNAEKALSLYGNLVTIESNTVHDLGHLLLKSASLHVVFMLIPLLFNEGRERHGRILQKVTELVEKKQLKPYVYTELPFNEVDAAHALLESGVVIGKVVLVNA